MSVQLLKNERETSRCAVAFAEQVRPSDVVGLEGSLGAGKTTFVRSAIHSLGVPVDEPIPSPTFGLIHQYQGCVPIVHADFYRLGDESELEELGVEEMLAGQAILFVEWGRKFTHFASQVTLWLEFSIISDFERQIRLSPNGQRGQELVSAFQGWLR